MKGRKVGEFKRSWRTACIAAGLPGPNPSRFQKKLVRAGVPETVAMRLTGHKTRSAFDRYNITSDTDFFTAAQMPDEFAERAKTQAKAAKVVNIAEK